MKLTFFVVGILCMLMMTVPVQAQDAKPDVAAQLQEARTALKDRTITVQLMDQELMQKREQVASLGRQLQEERQAHQDTKKALAKMKEPKPKE